jgi:hypothetical protein
MQLALSELSPPTLTGTSLTGTWSATFKNGDSFSGPAGAGLYLPNGYGITLTVQTPVPPCETGPGGGSAPLGFTLINVVVTSSRLTAVSGRISCNGGPPRLRHGHSVKAVGEHGSRGGLLLTCR